MHKLKYDLLSDDAERKADAETQAQLIMLGVTKGHKEAKARGILIVDSKAGEELSPAAGCLHLPAS